MLSFSFIVYSISMKKNTLSQNNDTPDTEQWHHPGGKLMEQGAESLSDTELLSIIIGVGVKDMPAEKIAEEIIKKFGSFRGMSDQPFDKFYRIKGIGETKIVRIAAVFEIARRIVLEVLKDHEK